MSIQKIYNVIGIMSGTSMDGIDCSYIKTNGKDKVSIISEKTYNYSNIYRRKLKKIIDIYNKKNKILNSNKSETFITNQFIKIINKFIKEFNIKKSKIDLIGFSGQTVFHNPENKVSIQLGNCKKIQESLGLKIIGHFRQNDLKNGGLGAPIGAFYHKHIIDKFAKNSAIINIGGVSNISFMNKKKLTAFDIGPGNALIDDLTSYFFKKNYDKDGKYAFKGKINEELIHLFKQDIFFSKKYPKTLDREYFKKYFTKLKILKKNDSICTASKMTIESILLSLKLINKKFDKLIITGGGRKNLFIMKNLKNALKNIKIIKIDKLNLDGDMLESQAFGYLSVRSYLNLTISIPTTTGVTKPISGGKLFK